MSPPNHQLNFVIHFAHCIFTKVVYQVNQKVVSEMRHWLAVGVMQMNTEQQQPVDMERR